MRKQQQMQQRKLINEPCLNKTFRKKICSTTEHVLAVRNFVTFLCSLLFTFQQRSSDIMIGKKEMFSVHEIQPSQIYHVLSVTRASAILLSQIIMTTIFGTTQVIAQNQIPEKDVGLQSINRYSWLSCGGALE